MFKKLFNKTLFKKLACVAAVALLYVSANPQSASPQSGPRPGSKPESFDGRLGDDDGAALAILFTANMRGNLDTCD